MTPTGGFWIPHTRCWCCSLLPLPWAGCLWPGLGTRQACSWAQLHGEVGEWGGVSSRPHSCSQRGTVTDLTPVFGTAVNPQWAHGLMVEVALVGQGALPLWWWHSVSSATSVISNIFIFIFFKIQFSVTNPLLFISCTFWPFYVNKTTKPQRLRIRLLETGLKRLPKM